MNNYQNQPWRSHYDVHVNQSMEFPPISVVGLFDKAVFDYGQKDFLIFGENKYSYTDIGRIVDYIAANLINLKIRKGERVALILPNIPQFIIAYYGILKAGGIVVAMNPNYTETELKYLFNDAKPGIVICLKETLPIIQKFTEGKTIFTTSKDDARELNRKNAYSGIKQDISSNDFRYLCQPPEKKLTMQKEITPDDPAIFQYTGGTTGTPKAAIGLHRNITANVMQFSDWCNLKKEKQVILAVIPLYHVYGMVLAMNLALEVGASIILIDDPRDIAYIIRVIENYRVTFYPGVPSMYYALNQNPKVRAGQADLSSINACISGASPLHPKIKSDFEKFTGGKLIEGYGLSEAPTASHCNPLLGKNKTGSIGFPLPGVACKIVDLETGLKEIPVGEIGELIIRGPQVMSEYYNRPDENRIALRSGWLFTGDVAKMDDEGYFYIVDRKKDLIKVSGFQVWPNEVEGILNSHPDLEECAVGGVLDLEKGEKVVAWVVKKPNSLITENLLKDFCRKKIAGYKVPAEIQFIDKIPRTGVGKILRKDLILKYTKKGSKP